MLDLFPGDAAREDLIAAMADWILRQIANVPGPEGRAALQDTIAQHPRMETLAQRYRQAGRAQRLKAISRRLALVVPRPRGLVDFWPSRFRGHAEVTGAAAKSLRDRYAVRGGDAGDGTGA